MPLFLFRLPADFHIFFQEQYLFLKQLSRIRGFKLLLDEIFSLAVFLCLMDEQAFLA